MEKRCYNCMELTDGDQCAKCGFRLTDINEGADFNEGTELRPGTVLKNRYYIGNLFSKTLDSVVYIAYDEELNKKVFVREFSGERIVKLAQNHSSTELVQRFLNYAKGTAVMTLCDILPRTSDTFAENHIGYMVSEYFEGESLKTLLNSGIKISATNALKITERLLKGLKPIHNSGIVFGSISPDTLYILKNGEVRLFGLTGAFYDFTNDIDCRVELLNPSYAAPELFSESLSKPDVSCDVYSVAAIFYRILTGTIPAVSFLRSGGENLVSPRKIDKSVPKNVENALLNALNWQIEKRTATPADFLAELESKKVKRKTSGAIKWANMLGFLQRMYDKVAPGNKKADVKSDDNSQEKHKLGLLWLWIAIPAVILIALIIYLVVMFVPTTDIKPDTTSTATSSEDIWYYGSGVETPKNSSEYVYGGYSSKKPTSSNQSNTSSNVSVDPNAVECPDLAGYSLEQARSVLEKSNLLLGEIIYDYSNDYPVDYVITQSVKSGGMIQKGSRIDIVVCKGPIPPEAEIPDVAGMDMKTAANTITAAGFTNIKYDFFLSDDAPGTVTDASFEDNNSTYFDSVVVITVSGEKVDVPDYSGKTVADAKALTPDINFAFMSEDGSVISSITDAGATTYIVTKQDVSEGGPAYKGMTITLTVKG